MDNKVTIIHSSVDTNVVAGTQTQTVIFEVNGVKKSWWQKTFISEVTRGYIKIIRKTIQEGIDAKQEKETKETPEA